MIQAEIIPIKDAKDYLGLDDDSRDTEVARMVKSAISWFEKRTNHIMVARNGVYPLDEGCVRVYDYPIGIVPDEFTEIIRSTYSIITANDLSAEEVTLPLGYEKLEDIPDDLVEGCYLMLKFFFNEQEGSGKIPLAVFEIADHYKRFII